MYFLIWTRYYFVSFLINSIYLSQSSFSIIIRAVLALALSLLLKFRKRRPEFKIISNLYGFLEGVIFLNFELLYCHNVSFSFSIFPLVRFITLSSLIFMKKVPNNKTKIFYLVVVVLLTINMMIANSIINPLGLSVLSLELCIFFLTFTILVGSYLHIHSIDHIYY